MNRTIETRDRILNAAERMFAEGGYSATSLRSIISAADVNIAAVHYYFRSKESLLEAVLARRLDAANAERIRLLEEYEGSLNGHAPGLEAILEIFLGPTFSMAANPDQGGYTFLRLMGRLQAESDLLPGMLFTRFGPVLFRFADVLARALPDLPPNELFWRSRLALGATAQILRDAPTIKSVSPDGAPDWKSIQSRLILYLAAGYRAPFHATKEFAAHALEAK